MNNLTTKLKEYTDELVRATKARDDYAVEYEIEKARMLFSAEVNAGNQPTRDAQVTLLLKEKGMYEKMANLRTNGKIAWYKWSAVKSLVDGKKSVIDF